MPKQQKEINVFNQGIILNADEQDIPINAATYSLNVNPNTKDGLLSGIKASRFITSVDDKSCRVMFPLSYGKIPGSLNDIASPITGDIIAKADSRIRVDEQVEPYKEFLGCSFYKVIHQKTNQEIFIHNGDIVR